MVMQLQRPVENAVVPNSEALVLERNDGSPKLDVLTSLRFFAAASVFFLHAQSMGLAHVVPAGPAHVSLSHGVSFFFALSGFLLAYRYQNFETKKSVIEYFGNRIGRIFPLYYLTAIPFLVVPQLACFTPRPWEDIPRYLLAIQAWQRDPNAACCVNPVGQSVSIEMFFYAFFPLLFLFKRRNLAWLCSTLIVVFFVSPHFIMAAGTCLSYSPVSGLVFFLAGIVGHECFSNWRKQVQHHRLQSALQGWLFTTAEAVALGVCIVLSYWNSTTTSNEILLCGNRVLFSLFLYVSLACSFGAMISIFAFGRGAISNCLKSPVLVGLGEASYALFLVHYAILFLFRPWSLSLQPSSAHNLCWPILALCITISLLLHKLVEAPLRKTISDLVRESLMSRQSAQSSSKVQPVVGQSTALTAGEYVRELGVRFFLPALVISTINFWFPPIKAFYLSVVTPPAQEVWKKIEQPEIAGTNNVRFGESVVLLAAKAVPNAKGVSLHTLWKARTNINDQVGFLATHLVDKTGKIVRNLDHQLVPAGTFIARDSCWEDVVELPSLAGVDTCGLALYYPQKQICDVVQGGRTDFGGRRLLVTISRTP
jgi:peptidoglycan/LPS O-acetylase OafA/YrhL